MVMARIFREYRNTVVNYKQFPSHLREKKNIFRVTAMFLFVLYWLLVFESSSKETSFWLSLVVETGKTYPGCLFHFSKSQQTRSLQSDTDSH